MAVLKNQRKQARRQAATLKAQMQQEQQVNKSNTLQPPTEVSSKSIDHSSIQQRSSPVSPQQKPIQLPVEAVEVVTSSSSSSPIADDESTPIYTVEEQKMLSTLHSVTNRISQLEFELQTLWRQIVNHCSRICMQRMKSSIRSSDSSSSSSLSSSTSFTSSKLHLTHKQLLYNAGMVDENVMQAIFKLDSIQTDNINIRSQRKATVAKANTIIMESMKMKDKLTRWNRFMPAKEVEPIVAASSLSSSSLSSSSTTQTVTAAAKKEEEKATMMQDDVTIEDEESEDENEDEEMEQKYAEESTPSKKQTQSQSQPQKQQQQQQQQTPTHPPPTHAFTASTSTPAPPVAATASILSPLQRKYSSLNLSEWTSNIPVFHSRLHPSSGSLIIESQLNGVLAEDILVSSDSDTRTLTIRCVKLPQQRRKSLPVNHRNFIFGFGRNAQSIAADQCGFFTKVISFSDLDPKLVFNLDGMSATMDNSNATLQVTVPRNPPVVSIRRATAAPQQYQQPRRYSTRQPIQHSSGASYSDEEEEEEETNSHPFAHLFRQQQQQQQQPRAAPRRVHTPSYGWW